MAAVTATLPGRPARTTSLPRTMPSLHGAAPARRRLAQVTEYLGASHQFDRPGPPRRNPNEQNGSRCFWEERPEGQLINRDSGQSFSLAAPCVVLGGSFGFDPAAYRQALQAVKTPVVPEATSSP